MTVNKVDFSLTVENLAEQKQCPLIDALSEIATLYGIEPEDINKYLCETLIEKLRLEGVENKTLYEDEDSNEGDLSEL